MIQISALFMIFFSVFGKFGAMLVTLPNPMMGGLFFAMFGMIAAVGLSTLKYINMNSPRNLFILGSSLIFGFAIPYWFRKRTDLVFVQGKCNKYDTFLYMLHSFLPNLNRAIA